MYCGVSPPLLLVLRGGVLWHAPAIVAGTKGGVL